MKDWCVVPHQASLVVQLLLSLALQRGGGGVLHPRQWSCGPVCGLVWWSGGTTTALPPPHQPPVLPGPPGRHHSAAVTHSR